jgi:hypothetical protein
VESTLPPLTSSGPPSRRLAAPGGVGGTAVRAFNEGTEHRAAKAALAAGLRARGVAVTVEASVGHARRTDLLAVSPAGQGVAIEIQHSAISLAEVRERTADHQAAGLATLWLPVLDLDPARCPPVRGAGCLRHARVAPPAWIAWLAERTGALWFWRNGALWRGWLDAGWVRARPTYSGRSPNDCGWTPSARLRTLTLEGPVAPEATRLLCRPAATDAAARIAPVGHRCATLLRVGETAPPPSPTLIDWVNAPDGFRPVVRLAGDPEAKRH